MELKDIIDNPQKQYYKKTIHKEYAETEAGINKILEAKRLAKEMNTISLDRDYYVRIDGISKVAVVESIPKEATYKEHFKESILKPLKKPLFEYAFHSFENFVEYKFMESIGEFGAGVGSLVEPFTLGIGSKVADNLSRPKAGSIQYGSREDVEKRIHVDKISAKSFIDTGVTSTVIPFTIKGISKILDKAKNILTTTYGKSSPNTKQYSEAIQKWGINGKGINQGEKHFFQYMKKFPKRIPSLEKRLGVAAGTFDNTAEGFKKFTKEAERVMFEATQVREINGKTIYYIDGAEKAKEGVVVIVQDTKIQSMMSSDPKSFLRLK